VFFIDPAERQHAANVSLPFRHKKMRVMLKLPLKGGPHRPKIKKTLLRPVLPPQVLDFSQVLADADVGHWTISQSLSNAFGLSASFAPVGPIVIFDGLLTMGTFARALCPVAGPIVVIVEIPELRSLKTLCTDDNLIFVAFVVFLPVHWNRISLVDGRWNGRAANPEH
jgi:hypothetical protein